jgi:hypothetical protein
MRVRIHLLRPRPVRRRLSSSLLRRRVPEVDHQITVSPWIGRIPIRTRSVDPLVADSANPKRPGRIGELESGRLRHRGLRIVKCRSRFDCLAMQIGESSSEARQREEAQDHSVLHFHSPFFEFCSHCCLVTVTAQAYADCYGRLSSSSSSSPDVQCALTRSTTGASAPQFKQ